MAHHKSAKTRIKRNEKRRQINKNRISSIRTSIKKVLLALDKKDLPTAQEAFKSAEKEIAKGASKGVMHKNTASRTVSRLSKKVKEVDSSKKTTAKK